MGWDFETAKYFTKGGRVDRKRSVDEKYGEWREGGRSASLVASAMVGATWYGAVLVTDDGGSRVVADVVETSVRSDPWGVSIGYKACGEACGPVRTDCPARILDLLGPPENDYAAEWRARCREKAVKAACLPKLKDLPIGTKIRFSDGGKEFVAEKTAPRYQFKRPWWRTGPRSYFPARAIPEDYEVLPSGGTEEGGA